MFVRVKKTHGYKYIKIAESIREGSKVKQRVLTTLGQLDALTSSGKLDALVQSLAKFGSTLTIIRSHREGDLQAHALRLHEAVKKRQCSENAGAPYSPRRGRVQQGHRPFEVIP
jgi:hypothetical protein